MNGPVQIGLGTAAASLLNALARFCEAEGLAASNLHSIQFLDDEVEVVIVRADGSRRHDVYPLIVLGIPADLTPTRR